MDFESPDVEREFPGLYASESGSGKRSQESDFSDDAHERSAKKELLIGKRKDKKESKKDQGYAALEGESSPEEDLDVKSPCKSKKSKSFKFPTIKEKREKSREKDVKEKERDKEKDRDIDRDKEKKKELKSKLKLKDKKKIKSGDDAAESLEEMPVFGVPLSVATERSHCHDAVEIPVVVRDCIDHVQECGLGIEGIYKIVGVKSKVQQLRRSYNKREMVKLGDYDLPTVTSLLKTFLRELPDPLLTTDLNPRFEDVVVLKDPAAREQELSSLIAQLPLCNRTCLSWIIRHLECVAANEPQNKMGVSALGTVLSPMLQTSPKVVSVLIMHCSALFSNVKLVRYVPPLSAGCTSLPHSREAIAAELAKQDSLLNQIHSEMNNGYTTRSDQLWEVQRFITLLKRKLRSLEKAQEVANQTEKPSSKSDESVSGTSTSAVTKDAPVSPPLDKIDFQLQVAPEEICLKSGTGTGSDADDRTVKEDSVEVEEKSVPREEANAVISEPIAPATSAASSEPSCQDSVPTPALIASSDQTDNISCAELDDKGKESHLLLEYMELLNLQNSLVFRISREREELEAMRTEFRSLTGTLSDIIPKSSDVKITTEVSEISMDDGNGDSEKCIKERKDLCDQNAQLMQERLNLVRQIMFEQEACISLRVQLGLKQASETK